MTTLARYGRDIRLSLPHVYCRFCGKAIRSSRILITRKVATKQNCQSRMKIPHFAGRKFPTPQPHKTASLASDAVEPSAVFRRVLGATESESKESDDARSCSRAGTGPALRGSFNR